MAKAFAVAWNIIRALIALFVLYFAYRCAQLAGLGDGPDAPPGALSQALTQAAAPAALGCTATSFTVTTSDKQRREYNHVKFAGSVTNNGPIACGVQLKLTTFDKNGAVVDSSNFWPASVRNIQPGAVEHFSFSARFDKAATNYEVIAIDARAWGAR